MPANHDLIDTRGLFRCCTTSARNAPPGREGDVVQCRFEPADETHRVIFAEGVWRWLREDDDDDCSA